MSKFKNRLDNAARTNRSLVCVGLDIDAALMPIADLRAFNRAIVDATKDLVCAYKPNIAFYEALGLEGLAALRDTTAYIRKTAPDAVLLADAKRGDIDSTSVKYAEAMFDYWGFDAVTVNGYMGGESLSPFFNYSDRGVFVVCRSSNPGARRVPGHNSFAGRPGTWHGRIGTENAALRMVGCALVKVEWKWQSWGWWLAQLPRSNSASSGSIAPECLSSYPAWERRAAN